MNNKIIQGQHLVDSFLKFFPDKIISDRSAIYSSGNHGKLSPNEISESIKAMVPDIFNRSELVGDKYEKLFRGDISEYNNDHSSADLALIGYLSKHGLNPKEADQIFRASNLYRPKWDERRGQHTYGEMTINKAFGSNHIESS